MEQVIILQKNNPVSNYDKQFETGLCVIRLLQQKVL